ncbi:MAG: helix-turn-helix domain-containing protein [Candidatus Aminicenantes bacterium]|nr:helix-turn-helix domain-containing protein [Candidatus Aminicenantes bacterium]NIM84659.1 helix-turn-helix domain-containing protein [Candidatus Aminicenantes bacterium]NIN24158.1 helix-turn-helix domain-containing protein [Candidatus Aminicenantes bacterium]NIN47883.1 helix-turn-helix domain-containing protein [Candidatus Aminicenantes bacterium]NIN90821.1 helix-turn-helix domain-containing protein [Candidatus Aminicenantes bacterium]
MVRCTSKFIFLLMLLFPVRPPAVLALDPNTAIKKYILHKWTTRDGLPQNTIHNIVQDSKGYLWLGTDRGIVRFDGFSFRTFDTSTISAIKNNSILSLLLSQDGSLWIGTYGGGIIRYRKGNFKNYSQKEGLPNPFINAIAEDDQHNTWFGTTGDGVIRFNGKTFTTITDADGLSYNIVTSLCYDNRGKLWVGTERGLNCLVEEKGNLKITVYTAADGLAGSRIEAIFEDSRGYLWIGTTNGISRIRNRLHDLSRKRFETITKNDGLADNLVRSIYEDKDNNIWVASNGGLSRIQIPTGSRRSGSLIIENFTAEEGLSDNALTSVFEDKWGNLWVGTSGSGLNMFREGKFSFYTEKDGLSSGYTKAIYEDSKDVLWIGTSGGGLNRLKDGEFTGYTREHGLSSNYIESIYGDSAGNLWVGTPNGLNRFKEGKFQVFTTNDGLSENSIKALFVDSKENLWIGTFGGGLNCFKHGQFQIFDTEKGLSDNFVLAVEEDRYGNIWVGTNRGINCLENNMFRRFHGREGVPQGRVLDIFCDYEGVVWIGTSDEGLVRYKDGVFTQFKSDKGFGSHVIYNVVEDNLENLWLSTNNGIFSVSGRRLNIYAHQLKRSSLPLSSSSDPGSHADENWTRSITWRHFQESDGLKTSVCSGGFQPAGCKTKNGLIWFPTIQGLAVMDLRRPVFIVQKEPIAGDLPGETEKGIPYMTVVRDKTVVLQKVAADGGTYDPHSNFVLPVGTEKIEFYFTAIYYGEPGNIMFKYRLEGYDDQWVVSSSRKSVVYLDIPAGDYEFTVMARPGGGDWSFGSDSCSFSIKYPFHETFWFYFIITVGLVFVFWGIPLLREMRTKKRKTSDEKYKGSTLTPKKSKLYLNQLLKIMEEEKPYMDPDLSLQILAKRMEITKEDLSQIINEQLNRNFKQFINEYRIEEAKKKLVDPRENQYVLLKIAFDVGFNSKSAFNASFKKHTGMSPSEYRKRRQEKKK